MHKVNWEKVKAHHAIVERLDGQIQEARSQKDAAEENLRALKREFKAEQEQLGLALWG